MSGNVINLVDVRLDNPRGGPPLVGGASLEVASGEVVMIVGAAAAGTSRVVAAMLGEAAIAGGRVEVLGRDVGKLRRSSLRLLRRRVGVVPQDLCLLEDRSAQLNVVLPLEIDGIPRSVSIVRAAQVLTQLGLEAEASLPVDCLNAAARQRVAVARAMVRQPDLLLADQPTSMQDPAGAELVCTALSLAAARGAAVIVFGRDPTLRLLADRHHWRQLALVDGALRPLCEVEAAGAIDRGGRGDTASAPIPTVPSGPLVVVETDELVASADENDMPNVVQFPIAAAGGVG